MNDLASDLNKEVERSLHIGLQKTPPKDLAKTVTSDIEALKAKLDTIARGIAMLREQL